jgi:CheY-like chemotaxis protein
MTKKLNCVLLVDDDNGANFINRMIIKEAGITDNIETTLNGKEALDYLNGTGKHEDRGATQPPELILLDINMPVMDGWEFLEEYNKLEEALKNKTTIILLTTSLNPDDKKRAEKIPAISGFENKPLDNKILEKLLQKHFQIRNN